MNEPKRLRATTYSLELLLCQREMKSLAFAGVILAILQYGCVQPGGKTPQRFDAGVAKPRFNQNVGTTEEEIRSREGVPEYAKLLQPGELSDELRAPVKTLVKKRGADTVVKELYFRSSKRVRVFWLVEENTHWSVISDASFTPSVRF